MNENNADTDRQSYDLDKQVGFLLRRANQRHLAIFSGSIADLTPTQFAVLAKLDKRGALSQNALGRETAMDAATIKGVVDRLVARGLLATERDKTDKRRTIVSLSEKGAAELDENIVNAIEITAKTLAPLSKQERAQFIDLLTRLC